MSIGSETLKNLHYDQNKLRVVLNRSDSQTEISLEMVEKTLGERFYHILPNDFRAASQSIKSGIPLVLEAQTTELGDALRELVYRATNQAYVEDAEQTQESGGFLSRLFGGRE